MSQPPSPRLDEPSSAPEVLAATEMLTTMLSTGGRGAPSIRLIYLTREAVHRARPDVDANSTVDLAVPLIKGVLSALAMVVEPNLDALRGAIGEILREQTAEAVRSLAQGKGTPAEWSKRILELATAAMTNAKDQFVGGVEATVQQSVGSITDALRAALPALCRQGVASRCAQTCTTTEKELTDRLIEAMMMVQATDVSDGAGSVDVAVEAGKAAAVEEVRERLRLAHIGRNVAELRGAMREAQSALGGFARGDEVLTFMLELAEDSVTELENAPNAFPTTPRGGRSADAPPVVSLGTSLGIPVPSSSTHPISPVVSLGSAVAGAPPTGGESPTPTPPGALSRATVARMTDEERLAAALAASMQMEPAPEATPEPDPEPDFDAGTSFTTSCSSASFTTSDAGSSSPSLPQPSRLPSPGSTSMNGGRTPKFPLGATVLVKRSDGTSSACNVISYDSTTKVYVVELLAPAPDGKYYRKKATDKYMSLPTASPSRDGAMASFSSGTAAADATSGLAARAVELPPRVLVGATNSFDARRVLGAGGFGTVYAIDEGGLAGIRHGGKLAVKRLDADSMQGLFELQNEIDLLELCRHEHLLPLLGFCLDASARCLVYPLMAFGNLEEAVMRTEGTAGAQGPPLTWRVRLRVLRAACRALLYLHTPCGPKGEVLHRDIKPANILLDEQYNAKLADVGLATHRPKGAKSSSHKTENLKGTIGYLDPLYMQTGMFTHHADACAIAIPPTPLDRPYLSRISSTCRRPWLRASIHTPLATTCLPSSPCLSWRHVAGTQWASRCSCASQQRTPSTRCAAVRTCSSSHPSPHSTPTQLANGPLAARMRTPPCASSSS